MLFPLDFGLALLAGGARKMVGGGEGDGGYRLFLLLHFSLGRRRATVVCCGGNRLGTKCHGSLDADRVENLLEARDRHGLVVALFVAADHLLTHT